MVIVYEILVLLLLISFYTTNCSAIVDEEASVLMDSSKALILVEESRWVEADKLYNELLKKSDKKAEFYLGVLYGKIENPNYDTEKSIKWLIIAGDKNARKKVSGLTTGETEGVKDSV